MFPVPIVKSLFEFALLVVRSLALVWFAPSMLLLLLPAGLLIMACNPIFKIADDYLPTPVVLFATFGGLRGTVSLILAQMLVTQQDQIQKSKDMLQTAQVGMVEDFHCCAAPALPCPALPPQRAFTPHILQS